MPSVTLTSLVGGGGGAPIGTLAYLNVGGVNKFEQSGQVWLRTGVVDTNIASYPDAARVKLFESTGVTASVAAQDISPRNAVWDGTHFWLVGDANDTVFKYDSTWTYTGTSFSAAAQDTQAKGIAWDGTHFWIAGDSTNAVYKYDSAGVYTGTAFSVAGQGNPAGLAWDGTHFWMLSTGGQVFQYDAAGVYTGFRFPTTTYTSSTTDGLTYVDGILYITSIVEDVVVGFTLGGAFNGTINDIGGILAQPKGVVYDGTHFWLIDDNLDSAVQFTATDVVGVMTQYADPVTKFYSYVRVK